MSEQHNPLENADFNKSSQEELERLENIAMNVSRKADILFEMRVNKILVTHGLLVLPDGPEDEQSQEYETEEMEGRKMTDEDRAFLLTKTEIHLVDWIGMSPWEKLGAVWEWANKQKWWSCFKFTYLNKASGPDFSVIDPILFPQLIVKWLRKEE